MAEKRVIGQIRYIQTETMVYVDKIIYDGSWVKHIIQLAQENPTRAFAVPVEVYRREHAQWLDLGFRVNEAGMAIADARTILSNS